MSEEPVDPAKLNRKTFRYTVVFTFAYAFFTLLATSPWFDGVRDGIAAAFGMLTSLIDSVLEAAR